MEQFDCSALLFSSVVESALQEILICCFSVGRCPAATLTIPPCLRPTSALVRLNSSENSNLSLKIL